MIWFDRAQRSIVVGCTSCGGHVRAVVTSQAAADNWAAQHLARTHPPEPSPERSRAVRASQQRTRRHADPA